MKNNIKETQPNNLLDNNLNAEIVKSDELYTCRDNFGESSGSKAS